MTGLDPAVARAVHEWVTGRRDVHARVLVAAAGPAVAAFEGIARSGDALLRPGEGEAEVRGGVTTIDYRGALREPGDELVVAGRVFELQDYVAGAFIDPLGPTVIRLLDAFGWEAFLADLDLAHETGVLPRQLTDPLVQLADRHVFADPFAIAAPDVIEDDGRGNATFGAQGVVLGAIDDPSVLGRPVPRAAVLGAVVPAERVREEVRARPWLARLMAFADLTRALPAEEANVRTSGLGALLVDDGDGDADPLADDAFLLLGGADPILAHPRTRRRFRLDQRTARIVEVIQTSASPARAAARIAADAGIAESAAESLRAEAVEALGVRHGVARAERSVVPEPAE